MLSLEDVVTMDKLLPFVAADFHKKNAGCSLDGVSVSFYRSDLQKNLCSFQTSVTSSN
jgi:hypothetical protein